MKVISTIPSIMVVESGQALPPLLYRRLNELGLDVLGPTDELFDAYRLARDRQPRLAIVDKRLGGSCRQYLHATLASLHVACFDLAVSACRRRDGLAALEIAMAPLYGLASREGPASECGRGMQLAVGRGGIVSGSSASSGPHLTA